MKSQIFPLFTLCLLLTTGCATRQWTPATAEQEQRWSQHQARLSQLQNWRTSGQVGVRKADDGWSASYIWQQQIEIFGIQIRGPFGQGMLELKGNAQHVQMKQAGQAPRVAVSADALVLEQTGWKLPVNGLRYWILGLPVPGQPERHRLNSNGSLLSLMQDGWSIEYKDHQQVDGLLLPRKLVLVNGDIRVKLIADNWQINEIL